jgi:hypothetical protein
MGIHGMYDAHRKQKPLPPMTVWEVLFVDPVSGPDHYCYYTRQEAERAAEQMRCDGMTDVEVWERPPCTS